MASLKNEVKHSSERNYEAPHYVGLKRIQSSVIPSFSDSNNLIKMIPSIEHTFILRFSVCPVVKAYIIVIWDTESCSLVGDYNVSEEHTAPSSGQK
jgi:hypothetical protein